MKTTSIKLSLFFIAFGLFGNALADSHRYVDVWTCTVKEGKTMDDVKAANAMWVKFMNANIEGGNITSNILTPVVGDRSGFVFADSYPSLEAWAAGEALDSDEWDTIIKAIDEVADCSQNSLHKSEAS